MAYYGAYGTVFKIGATTIGQLKNISGPDAKKETIDTTDLSTSGRNRTFISSLRDTAVPPPAGRPTRSCGGRSKNARLKPTG